jgi:uncharacterized membrane protein YhaH (DUF805 family)
MDFMTAVKTCINKYFSIQGRAQRSEYWWYTLFIIIVTIIAMVVDMAIGFPLFYMIVALGTLAPSICVAIRRMHDKGKSGWWLLIGLIPIIGGLYILYMFVTRGTEGDNDFGPDPLA